MLNLIILGILGYGLEKPSSFQQIAILPIIQGRDMIAQSHPKSGKTITFVIGTLHLIDTNINQVQTLVIVPTHDQAQEIAILYKSFGKYLNVQVKVFVEGTKFRNEAKTIEEVIHVVVGTTARVLELIKKDGLKLPYLKSFVIDEAEELVSKGLFESMKEVIPYINPDCNKYIFTDIIRNEIISMSNNLMNFPAKILLKNEQSFLKNIHQYYLILKENWKLESLLDIFKEIHFAQAIIYCNSKKKLKYLSEEIKKKDIMFPQSMMICLKNSEIEQTKSSKMDQLESLFPLTHVEVLMFIKFQLFSIMICL